MATKNVVYRDAYFWITSKSNITVLEHSLEAIQYHVDVFFEVLYPSFPLCHRSSMNQGIKTRRYAFNQHFFASIMAVCALTSAHASGEAIAPRIARPDLRQTLDPGGFFGSAKEAISCDQDAEGFKKGLEWILSCALLALYGIQIGDRDIVKQYLGMYRDAFVGAGLPNEKYWSKGTVKGIGWVETELRRRLFWSMYRVEVYSSIVWSSTMRYRGVQCFVNFPGEVNDSFLSKATRKQYKAHFGDSKGRDPSCWLHAWNFTTRLYHFIERAIDDFRRRPTFNNGSSSLSMASRHDLASQSAYLENITETFNTLPQYFIDPQAIPKDVGEPSRYWFSFQAAHIKTTMQIARFIHLACQKSNVEEQCVAVKNLLESLVTAPANYVQVSSSPMLHLIASLGQILASVLDSSASESSCKQVQATILQMMEFLSSHEEGIERQVGAAISLVNSLIRIDKLLSSWRQGNIAVKEDTIPELGSTVPRINGEASLSFHSKKKNLIGPFATKSQSQTVTGQAKRADTPLGRNDLGRPRTEAPTTVDVVGIQTPPPGWYVARGVGDDQHAVGLDWGHQ